MLKLIFRVLFIGLAGFIFYSFGVPCVNAIRYRVSGEVVQGRVSGFLAGRNTPSVQLESTGVRNGKRRARRPVFRYPVSDMPGDSLTGRSHVATVFSFTQFDLDEKVTVVFSAQNPQDSHIFSGQLLFANLLVLLLGLYMLYMGLTGRGG